MGYPFWVTNNNLGQQPAGTSLTQTPILLTLGETEQLNCVVSVLNGTLPPGVTITHAQYTVQLKGELIGTGSTQTYEFTLRASNGIAVADRTFFLTVIQEIDSFVWLTDNQYPLFYVYDDQFNQTQIQTQVQPIQAVEYVCTNLNTITQGIQLESDTGVFVIDLAWKPQTQYTAFKDYIYSNNRLYQAVTTAVSNPTQGPQISGSFIVDSAYPGWQPQRFYNKNIVVTNNLGKIYVCIQNGTSGTGSGPTGTGNYILDGSCVWAYQGQALVWNQIPSNTSVDLLLNCEARTEEVITRTFTIKLVSREAAPIWITPAGRILTVAPSQLFTYQLQVQDPDQTLVSWQSTNLPPWITLSFTGELQGQAPDVLLDTPFSFDVTVNDGTYSNSRTFEILITKQQVKFEWITSSELPHILDGTLSNLIIQASSPRPSSLISYGWVGGQLPLGVTLNMESGELEGFVEFHGIDKIYYFEIQANDGVETITQQFQIKVISSNRNVYYDIEIPLWGDLKDQIISQNNTSVTEDSSLYLPNSTTWGRTQNPSVTVMGGLQACDVVELREMISNYMHPFSLKMTQFQVTDSLDVPYHTLDIQLQDAVSPERWQSNRAYHMGSRVSVGTDVQYQALTSGTSSSKPPMWNSSTVQDGDITWQILDSPNTKSLTSHVLPWYAYHLYKMGDTVIRQGITYMCVNPGLSGGTWPQVSYNQNQVQDNQVIWQSYQTASTVTNLYWPSCIHNIREILAENLGWSNSWGSGAQAFATVDARMGSCVSVTVTDAGQGYNQAPPVKIISNTGTGAILESRVGILQADVLTSTTGVQDLDEFELDLGTGVPARLIVDGITPFDQAARISVIYPGSYTKIPSMPITVTRGSAQFTLRLKVGVTEIIVINPGAGYQTTDAINMDGSEWDPVRHTHIIQYDLNMCLNYLDPSQQINVLDLNNAYQSQIIPVNYIQVSLQGIQWQGNSRLDMDTCTFDSHMTRFIEITPASECTWDSKELSWDSRATTFDSLPIIKHPNLSQTYFDHDFTWFDYYSTLFDSRLPTRESRWKTSWCWFMSAHS